MRGAAAAFACFIILILMAGIGGIVWQDMEKDREIRLAQAQADAFEAQADATQAEAERLEAEAEYERAQGQRSLQEAQGRAIEDPAHAAADAVRAQTGIITAMGRTNTLYDRLLPLAGLLFMAVLVLAGMALGVGGLAAYLYLREKKKLDALKLVEIPVGPAVDVG